jgi:hypothetical protein
VIAITRKNLDRFGKIRSPLYLEDISERQARLMIRFAHWRKTNGSLLQT